MVKQTHLESSNLLSFGNFSFSPYHGREPSKHLRIRTILFLFLLTRLALCKILSKISKRLYKLLLPSPSYAQPFNVRVRSESALAGADFHRRHSKMKG